eukprot:9013573-Pyramimonas_sp.AAC.1
MLQLTKQENKRVLRGRIFSVRGGDRRSAEAKSYVAEGSAEARCFNAVPAEGLALDQLKVGTPGVSCVLEFREEL